MTMQRQPSGYDAAESVLAAVQAVGCLDCVLLCVCVHTRVYMYVTEFLRGHPSSLEVLLLPYFSSLL